MGLTEVQMPTAVSHLGSIALPISYVLKCMLRITNGGMAIEKTTPIDPFYPRVSFTHTFRDSQIVGQSGYQNKVFLRGGLVVTSITSPECNHQIVIIHMTCTTVSLYKFLVG